MKLLYVLLGFLLHVDLQRMLIGNYSEMLFPTIILVLVSVILLVEERSYK